MAHFPFIGRIISHYRILEKIGAGGMGEVYRAHDEHLDRDVAVKVLPAGILADEAVRKQFRKEALLLAKLNHPYIETIHEFGQQDDLEFLVMELIPGMSLSAKLYTGPLQEKEILRLGGQIMAGLAAAHQQSVIHRDLKPTNVFVTPDGRAKILDFGLAKFVHPKAAVDVTRSITTETGAISGTVPYMSPEQLRGEPADVRSDIYAAGALLYEMATGRRPFPQTQGPQLMGAILHETPVPPSALNPQISPGLESGIMKALEKDPSQRYQSARELESVLESLMAGRLSGVMPESAASVRAENAATTTRDKGAFLHKVIGTAITVIVLTGFFIAFNGKGLRDRLLHRHPSDTGTISITPVATAVRPSVAVLGFKNLSGRPDEAWLSTAISEMLTTELAVGEQLRTVPGENVARMKIDLALPDADTFGKQTLARIGKNLGTDDVVFGSYVPLEKGKIRLDLRLQNTAQGETLAQVSRNGTEEQLDQLVSSAGLALRQKLGVGAVSDADAGTVRASLPSNPEAARFYAEGLSKMRLFDSLAARDLLEQAVAADPNHALAHANLSAAWASLGYDAKAAAEGKRAFDLSAKLSRQEHLSVEAHYRETTREWDRAVEIYKALYGFFPDNLDYGISLAQAQRSAGNGTAALATVELLQRMPAPQNQDPRIDLAEALAAQSLSDFAHELKAATRAAEKGQSAGARLLVARARIAQGVALRQLGKRKEALAAVEDGKQIFAAAGDRNGVAAALNSSANVLGDQGDIQGAKKMYGEALVIYREIGNKLGAAKALGNIATEMSDAGDVEGGKKLCEEALVLFEETEDKISIANGQNNLATYLTLQGDLAGATKLFRQSLQLRQEIGDKGGQAESLNNLAEMLAAQGDAAAAKTAFDDSLRLHREAGETDATAYQLNGLGRILLNTGDPAGAMERFAESQAVARQTDEKPLLPAALIGAGDVFLQQGRLRDSRNAYEQALAIDKELGFKQEASESSLALATLNIEEGRAAEAITPIQQALQEFHTSKLSDDEISGHALLARALVATGKRSDALKEIESARGLAAKTQNRLAGMDFAIAEGLVLFVSGRSAEASKVLATVLADAKKLGLLRYEFETRLILAQIESKSGNAEASRTQLTALKTEATSRGFLLIARKATAQ
jgi:serine/threonine protein kinase/tetratricopeptide (TPR) repeat protein